MAISGANTTLIYSSPQARKPCCEMYLFWPNIEYRFTSTPPLPEAMKRKCWQFGIAVTLSVVDCMFEQTNGREFQNSINLHLLIFVLRSGTFGLHNPQCTIQVIMQIVFAFGDENGLNIWFKTLFCHNASSSMCKKDFK